MHFSSYVYALVADILHDALLYFSMHLINKFFFFYFQTKALDEIGTSIINVGQFFFLWFIKLIQGSSTLTSLSLIISLKLKQQQSPTSSKKWKREREREREKKSEQLSLYYKIVRN